MNINIHVDTRPQKNITHDMKYYKNNKKDMDIQVNTTPNKTLTEI